MIAAYQASSQARVNAALETLFSAPSPELARLYEAMRYSVMNGGKRVRPLLAYAACEALGGSRASQRCGLRGGIDPRLFAGARRFAGDGRRRSASRPADHS